MTRALSSIRALAADLPAVWSAATTTPADRQRIARLLLERVVVTVDKASERVDVTLHWVGGAVRPHTLTRPVRRYDQQSDYPRLVGAAAGVVRASGSTAAAIAERLNAEGFRPPKRTDRFTAGDGAAADRPPGAGPPRSRTAARPGWGRTSTGRGAWPGVWGSAGTRSGGGCGSAG